MQPDRSFLVLSLPKLTTLLRTQLAPAGTRTILMGMRHYFLLLLDDTLASDHITIPKAKPVNNKTHTIIAATITKYAPIA